MAPDQEVDQRGRGERLCKKILERILFREDTMDRSRWKKLAGKDWMVFRICEWVDVSSTGWSRKKKRTKFGAPYILFCCWSYVHKTY